jgi:hypothetical protein
VSDTSFSDPPTSEASSTSVGATTTITSTSTNEDTIRVDIAEGCPATVVGHHDGFSTAAGWIANPDVSGLDTVFVPAEPTAALICRYAALTDPTGVSRTDNGALYSSTPLSAEAAAALATTINDIVPSSIVSACLFADQEARYTAIVFAVPGRSDVDLWLKDWIGCPELSNGIRASGELINGVGSVFLSQLDATAPPAPQHHGFDDEPSTPDTSACCPPSAILSPQIGEFSDVESLVAALGAFGPLDNEEPTAIAEGVAPSLSICADIVMNNEPSAGTVVFQGLAFLQGISGVVLVLRSPTDSLEMRMYGVHDADPVTGGCPLLASATIAAG